MAVPEALMALQAYIKCRAASVKQLTPMPRELSVINY